jgi:hypothetical protein
MPSWREQFLIEAPPEPIWQLLGDPRRYPEWAGFESVRLTGMPTVQAGTEFEQTTRLGPTRVKTVFRIDELDELRKLRMHCTRSGWYSHWLLTPAQDATFIEVEFGIEPVALPYRAIYGALGTRHFRETARTWVDGLRSTLADERSTATAG